MCFNKWSSFLAEPLMLKQTVSNFDANLFLWTPQTKATVLFIYLSIFHHVLGGKTGASKSCQFSRLSHCFSILYFCYFCLQKGGEKERTFISCQSVLEPSPSSASLAEVAAVFFSYPFFRPCGKRWYEYMEAITRKRDTVVTLPHMSEIQMTSIQCATELRIIATAPLRGRSPPYCALGFFHLHAVSSRKHPARGENARPDLHFLFCTHCT